MKLFFAPGACALHVQVVAREAGVDFELVRANLSMGLLEDGRRLADVVPSGQIPALELDDGTIMAEGIVLSQLIADGAGRTDLVPAAGDITRYRVLEVAQIVATGLHVDFGPLFGDTDDVGAARQRIERGLDRLSDILGDGPFLVGDTFTIADAYAANILTWVTPNTGIDLARWPNLASYREHILARPSFQMSKAAEQGASAAA